MLSLRTLFCASAIVGSVPVLMALVPAAPESPANFHPHFPKVLTCQVTPKRTVTVAYQTVTFDSKAAEAFEVGKAWHLAGATFETNEALIVGGQEVAAGTYALSARKIAGQAWELVLHEGSGFSTKIGPDAHVLATTFLRDQPRWEHLNIDVQPGGDKKNTQLHLDVHFDSLSARALIEIPD